MDHHEPAQEESACAGTWAASAADRLALREQLQRLAAGLGATWDPSHLVRSAGAYASAVHRAEVLTATLSDGRELTPHALVHVVDCAATPDLELLIDDLPALRAGAALALIARWPSSEERLHRACEALPRGGAQIAHYLLSEDASLPEALSSLAQLVAALLVLDAAQAGGLRPRRIHATGVGVAAAACAAGILTERDAGRLVLAVRAPDPARSAQEVLATSALQPARVPLAIDGAVLDEATPLDALPGALLAATLGASAPPIDALRIHRSDDLVLAVLDLIAQGVARGALPRAPQPPAATPQLARVATEEVGPAAGPPLAAALQPAVDAFLRAVIRITAERDRVGEVHHTHLPTIVFTGLALATDNSTPAKLAALALAAAGQTLPSASVGMIATLPLGLVSSIANRIDGSFLAGQPSTAHAIAIAADWLRAGRAEAVVLVGTDAALVLELGAHAIDAGRPHFATLEHSAFAATTAAALRSPELAWMNASSEHEAFGDLIALLRAAHPHPATLLQASVGGCALALIQAEPSVAEMLPTRFAPEEPIFGYEEGTEELSEIPDLLDEESDAVFFSETLQDEVEDISDSPSASVDELANEGPLVAASPPSTCGPFPRPAARHERHAGPTRRVRARGARPHRELWSANAAAAPVRLHTADPFATPFATDEAPWTSEDESGEFTFPFRGADPSVDDSLADTAPAPMLYRPKAAPHRLPHGPSLAGHGVLVVGTDALAEAVRAEVLRRRGRLQAPYAVVIDVDSNSAAVPIAREAELDRGLHWVGLCSTPPATPGLVLQRAPTYSALRGALVTTLHLARDLSADERARLVCDAALASEPSLLTWGRDGLQSVTFEPLLRPATEPWSQGARTLLIGADSPQANALVIELAARGLRELWLLTANPDDTIRALALNASITLHALPANTGVEAALAGLGATFTHAIFTDAEPELAPAVLPLLAPDCLTAVPLGDALDNARFAASALSRGHALVLGAASWERMQLSLQDRAALLLDLLGARTLGEIWACVDLLPSPIRSGHPWIAHGVSTHNGMVLGVAAPVLLSLTEPATLIELLSTAASALRPGVPIAGLWTCESKALPAGPAPAAAFVEVTPVDAYSLSARISCRTTTGAELELARGSILLELAPEPDPLPPAIFPEELKHADDVAASLDHPFPALYEVRGLAQDGLIALAFAAQDPSLNTTPAAIAAAMEAAQVHAALVYGERRRFGSVEAIVWERDARNGEELEITVRQRGARYDVDVLGAEGPILHLRSLELVDPQPADTFTPQARPNAFSSGAVAGAARALADGAEGRDVLATADYREDADAWLDKDELADVCVAVDPDDLRGHIAAQIAAKRALAELVGVHPADVRLPPLTGGHTLHISPHGELAIAAAHSRGHAFAFAGHGGRAGLALHPLDDAATATSERIHSAASAAAIDAVRALFGQALTADTPLSVVTITDGQVTLLNPLHGQDDDSDGPELYARWTLERTGEVLAIARITPRA